MSAPRDSLCVCRRALLRVPSLCVLGARVPLWDGGVGGGAGRQRVSLDSLQLHAVRTLDPLTQHPFSVVYHHAEVSHANCPPLFWFRALWGLWTRAQKANLKALYIVHPTWTLRSSLYLLASFLPDAPKLSFWPKIVYVHRLAELQSALQGDLELPHYVLAFDRQIDKPTAGTSSGSR